MIVDFHSHILPEMDDGAENVEISLAMLRAEREQGTDRIVLTPHFYRNHEDMDTFLVRRAESYAKLKRAIENSGERFPELQLGAEVALRRGIVEENLTRVCVEGTNTLLLEFPYSSMESWIMHDVKAIISRNTCKVVFAHIERFRQFWKKSEFQEVMAMPVYKQINCDSLLEGSLFGSRYLYKYISQGLVHVLGSDAHSMDKRPVHMQLALERLRKKKMDGDIEDMMRIAQRLTTPKEG